MDRHEAIAAQNVFSFVDPEVYESLGRYECSSEYVGRLKRLLPSDWAIRREEIWAYGLPPDALSEAVDSPVQGFKIHVSSAPQYALAVLELIVPACVEEVISFKIAADPTLLHMLNSKQQGRGSSGKFMTIYPPAEDRFKTFIEGLYLLTREEQVEGPQILSDRRYRDSKILFYRFGGFRPPERLKIDGTRASFLVGPTGDFVPDRRLPYFELPDWVSDPFDVVIQSIGTNNLLLNGRYSVLGALGFSNAGGIYEAEDTATGRNVIVKEARPFTNCWTVGERVWDAVFLLKREFEVLHRLQDLEFVPTPIDLFECGTHTFLVEERIKGIALESYSAQEGVILAPYIRHQGRIERFVSGFVHLAQALISMVTTVHQHGVLLGDLSPRNVLIDPDTLRLSLIDFESAVIPRDEEEVLAYASEWGTPGFMNPARSSRGRLLPEDDLYAVAMILYSCVVPVNNFFSLNPEAESVFLDKFVKLGVPSKTRTVIDLLKRGRVDEANEVLANWST
jgi:hypothetical protein